MITCNILTIIFSVSVVKEHTLISNLAAAIIYAVIFAVNLFLISSAKSDQIKDEYELLPDGKKRAISRIFFSYLIITGGALGLVVGWTIYYKSVYGNYDL
jgi:hypothetical protein